MTIQQKHYLEINRALNKLERPSPRKRHDRLDKVAALLGRDHVKSLDILMLHLDNSETDMDLLRI